MRFPTQLADLAIELERMRAAMPDGGNAADLATELIDQLSAAGAPADLIEVLRQGLAARRALVDLGLGF